MNSFRFHCKIAEKFFFRFEFFFLAQVFRFQFCDFGSDIIQYEEIFVFVAG